MNSIQNYISFGELFFSIFFIEFVDTVCVYVNVFIFSYIIEYIHLCLFKM